MAEPDPTAVAGRRVGAEMTLVEVVREARMTPAEAIARLLDCGRGAARAAPP